MKFAEIATHGAQKSTNTNAPSVYDVSWYAMRCEVCVCVCMVLLQKGITIWCVFLFSSSFCSLFFCWLYFRFPFLFGILHPLSFIFFFLFFFGFIRFFSFCFWFSLSLSTLYRTRKGFLITMVNRSCANIVSRYLYTIECRVQWNAHVARSRSLLHLVVFRVRLFVQSTSATICFVYRSLSVLVCCLRALYVVWCHGDKAKEWTTCAMWQCKIWYQHSHTPISSAFS